MGEGGDGVVVGDVAESLILARGSGNVAGGCAGRMAYENAVGANEAGPEPGGVPVLRGAAGAAGVRIVAHGEGLREVKEKIFEEH